MKKLHFITPHAVKGRTHEGRGCCRNSKHGSPTSIQRTGHIRPFKPA